MIEMPKRWREPKAKPGELKVAFGKSDGELDLFYCHGGDGASKRDSRMVSHFMEGVTFFDDRNMRQELDYRGYDITTLKFTIQRKQNGE